MLGYCSKRKINRYNVKPLIFIATIIIISIVIIFATFCLFDDVKFMQNNGDAGWFRKLLSTADAASVDPQIESATHGIQYFISYVPCSLLREIPRLQGYPSDRKLHGDFVDHPAYWQPNTPLYDTNWVYLTAVTEHYHQKVEFGFDLKYQRENSKWNCLLKISSEILKDPKITSKMMINNRWVMGIVHSPAYSLGYKASDNTHHTIYFGGDEDVAQELLTYVDVKKKVKAIDDPDDRQHLKELKDDQNALLKAIHFCQEKIKRGLANHAECEFLVRDLVPIQYVLAAVQLTERDHGKDVSELDWQPLQS